MSLTVINKSPEKAEMIQNGIFYDLEYKDLSYGQDSTIQVEIIDEGNSISDLTPRSTCGCTLTEINRQGNTYSLMIVYDSLRKGGFKKQVQATYTEEGVNKKIIFNIIGKI